MKADQFLSLYQFYLAYSRCLDHQNFDEWPDFFVDDCVYKIQPRENFERGLPLSTLALTSKGMLKDRVYGIQETLFHDPYYQRHITDAPLILSEREGVIESEANYLVIRTKHAQPSEVFNAGRYKDRILVTDSGFLLIERICVFDTELIPNSIIYPL